MAKFDPCAPHAPPQCRAPVEQPFKPGIATRPSPQCDGNVCDLFACGGGNWRVTAAGTLDRSDWLRGWAITQLFTRGEIDCDEHPLGKRDGGWWADAFRSDKFKSGSKLWALKWAPATNDTLMTAKQYATEALQWLLTWGLVSKLTVEPLYVARNVIHLDITMQGPGVSSAFAIEGQAMANADWLWKEYRGVRP